MQDTVVVFIILMGVTIVQANLYAAFLSEMRSRHPDTWESLGSPTAGFGSNFTWPVVRFLWRKDYRELNDAAFTHRSDFVRLYGIVWAISLWAATIWIFTKAFIGATRHI